MKCNKCGRFLKIERVTKYTSKIDYCECTDYKYYTGDSSETLTPPPMIRPQLNSSDLILIRNALEILKPQLIIELQERVDLIVAELLRAEKEIKG